MQVAELLDNLEKTGIRLKVDDGKLRFHPKSAMTPDILESLRECKQQILAYLLRQQGEIQHASNNTSVRHNNDLPALLAWASCLSNQKIILKEPISFIEAERRPVQVLEISAYAARHLTTIASCRLWQPDGGWGRFNVEWWQEREKEAITALANMRKALSEKGVFQP